MKEDLARFKEEAKYQIFHDLTHPPTHDHCNSDCPSCVRRICCVHSPHKVEVHDTSKQAMIKCVVCGREMKGSFPICSKECFEAGK